MKIFSFFRLIRWHNLLLTALMMFIINNCLLKPVLINGKFGTLPSDMSFVLIVIAMVFIVAGGYIVNDLFDVEIDKVNKPKKVIVGKVFTIRETWFFYVIVNILGLIAAVIASFDALGSKAYIILLFFLLLIGILYSYSSTYKKRLISGNLIVSAAVASSVILPWLFEFTHLRHYPILMNENAAAMSYSLRFVGFYTLFAFLITLCREIVKDMEDVEGDRLGNCSTIPLEWGMKTAKIIVSVIGVVLVVAIYIFYAHTQDNTRHSFFDFDVFINMTAVVILFSLKDVITFSGNKRNLHSASVDLKIAMFIGVLSMLFINL